jgi:hypothetical protein
VAGVCGVVCGVRRGAALALVMRLSVCNFCVQCVKIAGQNKRAKINSLLIQYIYVLPGYMNVLNDYR